jgi:lipopolysaccharide export system protein LptC
MAVTSINGSHAASRGSGLVVDMGDRAALFRAARRHSALVRVLRVGLPLASVAALGFFVRTVLTSESFTVPPPAAPETLIDPEKITMDHPHYKGFNPDGGHYEVEAEHARQDLKRDGFILMQTVNGVFHQADRTVTHLTARRGAFDSKGNILDLFDDIHVDASSDMKARLEVARVNVQTNVVTSARPVDVTMPTGTVRGNTMELHQKSRRVTFIDAVAAHLVPPPPAANAPPAAAATAGQAPLFAAQNGPIDVTSSRLDIDDNAHTAVFTTNVKAIQGDAALETPELKVVYAPRPADPAAAPAPAGGAVDPQGQTLKQILAKGPVLIVRVNGDEARSDALEHDAVSGVTRLVGNVALAQQPDKHVTGDLAEINGHDDTMVMTGATVHIVQGRNELHGRRLTVDQRTGKSHLSVPAEGKAPAGRVQARFYQGDGKTPAKPIAPTVGDDIAGFKTDPSLPIDIEADVLDADDHAKVAIFRGNVKARQGDFAVAGAELTAHYSGSGGLAAAPAVKGAPTQPQGGSALTRIDVRRNVTISGKNGQTAVGDAAEFDVKANRAVVNGSKVTLSQKKNVSVGTRLTVDLNSGEAVFDTAPVAQKGGPTIVQKPGGRASADFFPNQLQDGNAAAAPPAAGATAGGPAASSWETHTAAPGH